MSRRRMYFDLGSSPERRNFIWGNICLEGERGRKEENMEIFIERAKERNEPNARTPIKVSFVTKCVNRRGV